MKIKARPDIRLIIQKQNPLQNQHILDPNPRIQDCRSKIQDSRLTIQDLLPINMFILLDPIKIGKKFKNSSFLN